MNFVIKALKLRIVCTVTKRLTRLKDNSSASYLTKVFMMNLKQMGIRTFTQKKNDLTVTLVESVTIHGGEI